jgi:hypothetical protein
MILLLLHGQATAQVWQWAIEVEQAPDTTGGIIPRAYLWIPENCKQVKGVVVAQQSALEENILGHKKLRDALEDEGFAEVLVAPGFDPVFDFIRQPPVYFHGMMKKLGEASGYTELEFAPVIPLGQGPTARYPWNFAAWAPGRTLAVVSLGSGPGSPDDVNWGEKGNYIPSLFVLPEEDCTPQHITPALTYFNQFMVPLSFLADVGCRNEAYSENAIAYIAAFIRKAADKRLPSHMATDAFSELKPVDPQQGWLADRWRADSTPVAAAAPYKMYTGDRQNAFWYFDKDLAAWPEKYYAAARQKPRQYAAAEHAVADPEGDVPYFSFSPYLCDSAGGAKEEGKLRLSVAGGPAMRLKGDRFALHFPACYFARQADTATVRLLAASEGSSKVQPLYQLFRVKVPCRNQEGIEQKIIFPPIGNITTLTKTVLPEAKSGSGLPVAYTVAEGPAEVSGERLVITKIPPKAKYPVKVTVIAWQYGRGKGSKVQTAEPVRQSFYISKPVIK